ASPTWLFSAEAEGGVAPEGLVGADQPPRWHDVKSPTLTWIDRRAAARVGPSRRWAIPVLAGGRRSAIACETAWGKAGSASHGRRWWPFVLLAGVILAGAGRILVTRTSLRGKNR